MKRFQQEGREAQNLITIIHKGKAITTSVGSKPYENLYGGLGVHLNFPLTAGFIPPGYEHRPDLIANLFSNSSTAWWRICEVNNIFDNFEQLKSKTKIYLPGVK
jgi:hypothetical protein